MENKEEIILVLGVAMSFIGFYQAMNRKSSGRPIGDLKQIFSTLFYPGGYIFVLLHTGQYLKNFLFITLLNFILYPAIWGISQGLFSVKKSREHYKKFLK